MDASLQLRKPRKSIRTLAGAAGASHLFRRLIPLKIKDGIFVCHRMSKLESLSARANGTCHRAIISQRCWLRASFVTRQANRSVVNLDGYKARRLLSELKFPEEKLHVIGKRKSYPE